MLRKKEKKGIVEWKYQWLTLLHMFCIPCKYIVATVWNDIPDSIKMIDNLAQFKNILWKHMTNVS